ncbi:MAG TPA: pyridoxal phosphate-dependent aminotransferase [Methylomirabilota bacterium]|nr:pyridoxal phosphate-dependent aminotransferase [Methylomirabilota bacterium]
MLVSRTVTDSLAKASWIRRMFEEGARLKQERGADKVFDFTLGNPEIEPPEAVLAAARRVLDSPEPHRHAYMPNAGHVAVREAVAKRLRASTGLPYTAAHVIMTVGAGAALNTVLKALLNPGDEVLTVAPFFAEYVFYAENHGGRLVVVLPKADLTPDISKLEAAITPKTRAILVNSPNNPSGVIYPASVFVEIEAMLARASHPIVLVSDEPYRALVFDDVAVPEVPPLVSRSIVATSWSKSLAIPGERIGYLAFSPRMAEAAELFEACTFTSRVLGFVNAPALWQWVVAEVGDQVIDVSPYREKRDLMYEGLTRIGYQCVKPQGAFYVFPRTPIDDDVAFVRLLAEEGVLTVPGSGFGMPGHIRISLTVERETVVRALPGFERAFRKARGG